MFHREQNHHKIWEGISRNVDLRCDEDLLVVRGISFNSSQFLVYLSFLQELKLLQHKKFEIFRDALLQL